jgi:hypothetical protein
MEMRALGLASPTDQLFRINIVAAIKSVIQQLPSPWINDFEFMRLSPSQKKEFKPLAGAIRLPTRLRQGWAVALIRNRRPLDATHPHKIENQ